MSEAAVEQKTFRSHLQQVDQAERAESGGPWARVVGHFEVTHYLGAQALDRIERVASFHGSRPPLWRTESTPR